jgi:hypothetical protein
VALTIGVVLLFLACGSESSTGGAGSPNDNVANTSSPDTPVANTPGNEPPTKGGAQRVVPDPDVIDALPHIFEKAKVLNETTVRLFFYQGVAPCSALQRVDVEYGTKTVGITLFVGHETTEEDAACIEIAVYNYVDVPLDEPIDDRKIVDGAS